MPHPSVKGADFRAPKTFASVPFRNSFRAGDLVSVSEAHREFKPDGSQIVQVGEPLLSIICERCPCSRFETVPNFVPLCCKPAPLRKGSCLIALRRRMHRYDRRVRLSLRRVNRRWSSCCARFKITIVVKLQRFIGVPYWEMRKRAARPAPQPYARATKPPSWDV